MATFSELCPFSLLCFASYGVRYHLLSFENDSGIDSLRQDCSSCTDKGDVGTNGETIRRKGGRGRTHVVQRRKSLGAMVDPTELEQICLGNDLFWLSTEECGTDIISSSAEMDTCLRYHLLRVHSCLQVLEACDVQSPFSFKATEMLKKLGSEEVSLEQLLQISTDAPLMPNILKVMSEFDVDPSLQEIWMSTSSPLNAQLVVPSDDLRTQIKLNIAHIVEQHYPHLVNRVADSIMRLLLDCAQDDPKIVTLFHFVGVFRGRSFVPFVENLGHDAWMISLLSSGQASRVLQVADRLCRVPVVPPLESLKHIAMTLADSKNENRVILEKYLFSARGLLLDDLHSSFLYLLEAEEEIVRIGAIRALSALQVTFAFTIFCSMKIMFTPQQDDIRTGYTPHEARSRREMAAYNEYFASSGDPIMVFAFVVAKDGGSLARLPHMKEVVDQMDFVGANVSHDGYSYLTLCTDFCQINEPIRQFYNGLVMRANSSGVDEPISITFPIMDVLGKGLDLSPNFFGVQSNGTDGSIEFLKVVGYQFRANPPSNWTKYDLQAYERKVSAYFHKEMMSDLLDIYSFSLTYTSDEIVRTGLTIFPYLAVGFAIMSVFSVVTIYYCSSQMDQWSKYKIVDAVFGCICPLLATSSALGFLFWCGFRFATILCVTPFLVLAIGVDDAYLMMYSWMRISNADPTAAKRDRISQMLVDVGPSVTITSLTNFLAFLIGFYTPTPEIQLFCFGNAVAILFDFFYQITMFAALLSITGGLQIRKDMEAGKRDWDFLAQKKLSKFLDDYSRWLADKFTAGLLLVVLCCYWFASLIGTLQIQVVLSADKLVLQDSLLIKMNHLREHYVLVNYTTANIFIQNPGDLHIPDRLRMMDRLVERFEAYPECLGSNYSHYFVRDYKFFREKVEMEEEESFGITADESGLFSRAAMQPFFSWPEFKHWNGFVRFDRNGRLHRIWVTVSYHGELMGDNVYRKTLLERWRDTADSFPELNVSVFDDYSPFLDQLDSMLPATVSTSICTLLCMMIVCFLFMYNVFTVMVATASIVSICMGVFGLLSFWGIDLDPISMATTIMSIGFSVDFPAHITFHYYREGIEAPDSTPARRVAKSLSSIGFPLLQCGLSTILFVLCLLFVRTYMSEVFVKTMVLVVTLSLLHGLVFVPAILCALTSLYETFFKGTLCGAQTTISECLFCKNSPPCKVEGSNSPSDCS